MKILDLIDPKRSDIRYKRMTFPDGQPHFQLLDPSAERFGGSDVEVLCRIKSPADIFDLALAMSALWPLAKRMNVNIAYLMGARMDRRIDEGHPFTLAVIAGMLLGSTGRSDYVRVLDPHSDVSLEKLALGTAAKAVAIHPDRLVKLALQHYAARNAVIVVPDEGAVTRTGAIVDRLGLTNPIARCVKKRDSATGKLSGFALVDGDVSGQACMIVDDLCDGGGTFAGIAAVLRAAGAVSVALCVTHAILSKGSAIEGIDAIYCTDSFQPLNSLWGLVPMEGRCGFRSLVRPDGRALVHVLPDFLRDHVQQHREAAV